MTNSIKWIGSIIIIISMYIIMERIITSLIHDYPTTERKDKCQKYTMIYNKFGTPEAQLTTGPLVFWSLVGLVVATKPNFPQQNIAPTYDTIYVINKINPYTYRKYWILKTTKINIQITSISQKKKTPQITVPLITQNRSEKHTRT